MAKSKTKYHFNYLKNKPYIEEALKRQKEKLHKLTSVNRDYLSAEVDMLHSKIRKLESVIENLPEPDARGVVAVDWRAWQFLDSATSAGIAWSDNDDD